MAAVPHHPRPRRLSPRRWRAFGLAALGVVLAATAVLAVAPAAGAAAPTRIVNGRSGLCIDVNDFNTTNGTQLQLWGCNGGANQQVTVTSTGQLKVLGKCLDASGASRAAGTAVKVWTCTGVPNQRWSVVGHVIKSPYSGLCLDANAGATTNGTLLKLWTCTGATNQNWTVQGATVTIVSKPTTGAATPSTSCAVKPVDPQATAAVHKVLCYLYSQYGNHILSGQHTDPNHAEIDYIHDKTGKYPAIAGFDVRNDAGTYAASYWNAGGLLTMSYHMGAPNQGQDGYNYAKSTANIDAAVTEGTADNTRLKQRMDTAAVELRKVANVGGVVLWRPYHEAGGTWFWWSKQGGAEYQKLWRYSFNYMTKVKGLHNLIWLLGFNGSPQASFYPGKAYVDLAGPDAYADDHGPLTGMYNATKNVVGGSVPVALHENGRIPDPDQLQSTRTRYVYFATWGGHYITDTSINAVPFIQKVYGSSYVVTRDELPNLK